MVDNDEGDDNDQVCLVYSNTDHFTVYVQVFLGVVALLSLYVKRQQEYPKRRFKTWAFDVSKQGFGALYAHIMNMVIATIISENVRGEMVLNDQCAWYAINYTVDSTVGLVLSLMFLKLLDYVANKRNWAALKDSGIYQGDDAITHWLCQVSAWLVILSIVKVLILYFMWLTSSILAYVGQWFFGPLQANIRAELVFVMVVFPGVVNIIYFWIVDSFLKTDKHSSHAHEDFVEDESKQEDMMEQYEELPDVPEATEGQKSTAKVTTKEPLSIL